LREVLAATDHDFVLSEPVSKLRYFWQRLRAPKRRASRYLGRRGRRIAPYLAAGFFAVISTIILFNALAWQKNRHSAPLFFSRAASAKAPKNADALAPQAPRRAPPAVSPVQKSPPERPPQDPTQVRANVLSSTPHDQISDILQATPPPSSATSKPITGPPKPPAPSKAVLNAQRALVKLGYVLKANGVVGASTRKAVARYEGDHGLPVRGELTPVLMQRLNAEAGISTM
jgi:Putative peptidoglycan binding domain